MPFYKKKCVKTYRKPTLAKKVAKLSKQVKINKPAIFRSATTEATGSDVFTTATVVELTPVGITSSGTDLKVYSLNVRGMIDQNVSTTQTELTRLVLVKDNRKFDNDVAPVWTDVFFAENVWSPRQDDTYSGQPTNKAFSVLSDRIYSTEYITSQNVNKTKQVFSIKKSWKNPMAMVDATTYQKNRLFLMSLSTAATGKVDLSFYTQFRYSID